MCFTSYILFHLYCVITALTYDLLIAFVAHNAHQNVSLKFHFLSYIRFTFKGIEQPIMVHLPLSKHHPVKYYMSLSDDSLWLEMQGFFLILYLPWETLHPTHGKWSIACCEWQFKCMPSGLIDAEQIYLSMLLRAPNASKHWQRRCICRRTCWSWKQSSGFVFTPQSRPIKPYWSREEDGVELEFQCHAFYAFLSATVLALVSKCQSTTFRRDSKMGRCTTTPWNGMI